MNSFKNNFDLEQKHTEIIEMALDQICELLRSVEILNAVIKENQIRRFRKEWFQVLNGNLDATEKIYSIDFNYDCRYLFGRMNDANRIRDKILKLTGQIKKELRLIE